MIELFSGVGFFAASIALANIFLAIKKAPKAHSVYRFAIAVLSIVVSALVYGDAIAKPLFLLAIAAFLLRMRRAGFLSKKQAVILTLLPLIVGKVTTLPLFAMLGLSFATFRAIDVLLFSNEKQPINALEYVAYLFLPLTLLAGPMYRWQGFQKDMTSAHEKLSIDSILEGLEIVLLGIVQKFLVAEAIDRFLLSNINAHDFSVKGIALNAIAYSAFLYFDFSGYSNMAIGIGKMFGLNIPRNFDNPILSRNPQDFWRRWHISLSEWLRDVIFMPVYMTLCKSQFFSSRRLFAQNIGIFLTLLAMGTWNGISLHYVVSGVMFGTYSAVFNVMVSYSRSVPALRWMLTNPITRFLGRVITVILAMLALYVFSGRSPI